MKNGIITMCAVALAILFTLPGCNYADRLEKLEKANKDLQAQLESRDLELQAKCSKDAEAYFRREWTNDPGTILLQQTNHYNEARNKCFVWIQYNYDLGSGTGTWHQNIMVYDVYENLKHAHYSARHRVQATAMITCEVAGKKCQSIEEFMALASPYMNQ